MRSFIEKARRYFGRHHIYQVKVEVYAVDLRHVRTTSYLKNEPGTLKKFVIKYKRHPISRWRYVTENFELKLYDTYLEAAAHSYILLETPVWIVDKNSKEGGSAKINYDYDEE